MTGQLAFEVQARPGEGNGRFLGDLANGANAQTLRKNWQAGKYPDASPDFMRANLKFWRMT